MAKKTILVISSEEEINRNIHKVVDEHNFSVVTAVNDQFDLTTIQQKPPDLILCQLSSPEVDGYQILTELRKSSHTFTIPFIFIATKFDARQWRKAMALGADDFLLQPFTDSELYEAIDTRLIKQEALIAHYEQELDYLRSSILDFLPHEMRTALTGILASSDLLLSQLEQLDPSIIRDLLGCIDSSGQRLSRLVHNFLLYSELKLIINNPEQIKSLRSQKTCSSSTVVEKILAKLGKGRHRQIEIGWHTEDLSLAISPLHLTKLIEELIDNAIKFSSKDTPIKVSGRQNGDYFHLVVLDRGRGMTAKQIALIGACIQFDRPTHEQQGCGLGLAIVKQLLQVYEGKLVINSVLNQETRVNIYIPLVKSSLFLRFQPKHQKKTNEIASVSMC